jgi:hypothetical protein
LHSEAILDLNMTLEVVTDDIEVLEHVVVDDKEQSAFAEVDIFSHRSSELTGSLSHPTAQTWMPIGDVYVIRSGNCQLHSYDVPSAQ